jgi:hypothetical protein
VDRRQLRFDTIRIGYEKEVPTQKLVELVDELSQDFLTVETCRSNFRIGASGLTPDVGVVLILGGGAVAGGFLAELGKDLYRELRGVLFRVYNSLRIGITPSGRVWPLAIDVHLGEPVGRMYFMLEEDLTEEQFREALTLIPTAMSEFAEQSKHSPGDSVHPVVAKYDPQQRRWCIWP